MIDNTIEIRESVEYTRKDNESIESGKISIYFSNIPHTEEFLERIRLICKETRGQKPTIEPPVAKAVSYFLPEDTLNQPGSANESPGALQGKAPKRKPKHKDWSDEEKAIIDEGKTSAEAVEMFFFHFPESERTRPQIQSYWCYRHPKQTREPKVPVFEVGNRVTQISGKEPAFGPGKVTSILADGRVKVQFLHRVKVLDPKHFRLYEELPDA